jgi:hypothetical protein
MMRYGKLVLGALVALLLLPTNAAAFAVTADRASAEYFVGETVRLTLSGEASGLLLFTAGITPDPAFLGYVSTDSAPIAGADALTDVDPSLTPPIIFVLLSNDPDFAPFDIVSGPIFDINFLALNPTAPGTTTVSFDICTTLDLCDPNDPQATPPVNQTINITILQRTNNVPEPATLWLAVAALVAGGVVFRNNSKRS